MLQFVKYLLIALIVLSGQYFSSSFDSKSEKEPISDSVQSLLNHSSSGISCDYFVDLFLETENLLSEDDEDESIDFIFAYEAVERSSYTCFFNSKSTKNHPFLPSIYCAFILNLPPPSFSLTV